MWFRWSLLWCEWWDGWDWALVQHPATSEDQLEQNSWAQMQIREEAERIMMENILALHSSFGLCSVYCWFLRACFIYAVFPLGCRELLPKLMLTFGWDFEPGGQSESRIWFHPVSLLESLKCQRSQWDGTDLFDFACICCTLGVHISLRGEHGSTKCHALWRTHLVSGDNISDWWGHLCLYCVCFSVTGGVTGGGGVPGLLCVPGFVWNGATWSWIKPLFKRIRDRWRPIVSGCVY